MKTGKRPSNTASSLSLRRLLFVAMILTSAILLWRIADRGVCQVWHGEPSGAVIALGVRLSDFIIFACYLGIPITIAASASKVRLASSSWVLSPAWLTVYFVYSCGATHLASFLTRPVVACWEDLVLLLICAIASLAALAGITRRATPAILLLRFVLRLPQVRSILELENPEDAAAALRHALGDRR